MLNVTLNNFVIRQLLDKNGNTYYLFKDNDTNEGYFAFKWDLSPSDWTELENNWQSLQEVEIQYQDDEKGKRVLALLSLRKNGDYFV